MDTGALFCCGRSTENVEGLVGRVGADDGEIFVRTKIAVPRPRWKQSDIATTHLNRSGLRTTKHETGRAVGKAQNFVPQAVIVVKRIDAIPPLRWPAVMGKQVLIDRLTARPRFQRIAIDDDGKIRIVRHPVIGAQRKDVHVRCRGACMMDPALSEGQSQPCQQGVEIASVHRKGTIRTIEVQDRQVRERTGNHTRLKRLSFL